MHRAGEFAFQELARARQQLCHILTSLLRMAIADCVEHPAMQRQADVVGPVGYPETGPEPDADQAAHLQQQIVMAAGQDGPVKTQIRLDSGCTFAEEPPG